MSPEKIKRWSEAITEAGKGCAGGWKARLLGLLLLVFISGGVEAFAQGNPSSSQPNQNNNDSYPIRGAGDVRFYDYFPRYPAAACFGPQCDKNPKGKDIIENRESKKDGTVKHGKSGPVYEWPIKVKECISKVPTKRDEAINEHMLKTFGYPISDTQFQMIHRFDNQIMLEQMFDPERLNWTGAVVGATQMQDVANGAANTCRNQCASAIDFVGCSIYNFTIDESNKWNKVRNELFLPMAVLLLLPGAVLAQLRVIVAAGMPIQGGDVNPFEGITRSIVAIFLIPATYLVVNYGIDLNNSITYTIYSEYQRIFGTDMYKDALCAVVRAHPVRQAHEDRNAMDKPSVKDAPKDGKEGTPAQKNELTAYDVKKEDPNCNGPGDAPKEKATEMNSFLSTGQRALTNTGNAGLAAAWNILCAFQVVFLMYLWFVGPVVAALWVYPSAQLRGALPSWTEGVITLCFWSLFWNTTVLLMACFKGIDETGTIIQSALIFLATASVKFAFDFAGLVKAAGAEAGGMAAKAAQNAGQGAGASPGAPGGRRGGGSQPGQPTMGATAGGAGIGQDQGGAAVTMADMSSGAMPTSVAPTGSGGAADSNTGGASGSGGTGGTGADGTTAAGAAGAGGIPLTAPSDANAVNPDGKPLDSAAGPVAPPMTAPLDANKALDPTNSNNLNSTINAMTGQQFTPQQLAAMAANVGAGEKLPFNSEQLKALGVSESGGKLFFDANGQPLMGANGQLGVGNVGAGGVPGVAGGAGSPSNAYNMMSGTGGPAGMIPPPGTSVSRTEALGAASAALTNARTLDAAAGFAQGTGPREAAANQLMGEVKDAIKAMDEKPGAPANNPNMNMTPGLYQAMQAQQGDAAMSSMVSAQGAFSANFAQTGARLDSMLSSPNGQVSQQAQSLASQASGLYSNYQAAAAQGPMSTSQLLNYNQQLANINNSAVALGQNPMGAPGAGVGPMVDASQARAALSEATNQARTDSQAYMSIASASAGALNPYSGAPAMGAAGTTASGYSQSPYASGGTYSAPVGGTTAYTQGQPTYGQPAAPTGATGYAQAPADAGAPRQVAGDVHSAPTGGGYVNNVPGYGAPAPAPGGFVQASGGGYAAPAPGPAPSTPLPSSGSEIAYSPNQNNAPSSPAPIQSAPTEYSGGQQYAPQGGYGPAPAGGYNAPSGGDYTSAPLPLPAPQQPNYSSSAPPPPAPTQYNPAPQYQPNYNAPPAPQGGVQQNQYPQQQQYAQGPSAPQQQYTQGPSPEFQQRQDYYNQNQSQPAAGGTNTVYVGSQPTQQSGPVNHDNSDTNVKYQTSANHSPTHSGGGMGPVVPVIFSNSSSSNPIRSGQGYYAQRPSSSSGGSRPSGTPPQQAPRPMAGPTGQARAGGPVNPGGVRRNNENLTDVVRNQTLRNKGKKQKKNEEGLEEPPSWLNT